jgi:hypothetical protein
MAPVPAYSPAVRGHRASALVRASAAGLIAAVLLGGCSEKQEASTTLPSTSATPATESLPVVGPADFPVPDEARTKDAAGAEAFLQYFLDLLDHQREIPDGQPIRELGPECQDCLRIAQNYDDVAAAGQRYKGGELSLIELAKPLLDGKDALISFSARREAVSVVDGRGATIEAIPEPAPSLSSGIDLTWSEPDQCWLVKGFNLG